MLVLCSKWCCFAPSDSGILRQYYDPGGIVMLSVIVVCSGKVMLEVVLLCSRDSGMLRQCYASGDVAMYLVTMRCYGIDVMLLMVVLCF